MPVVTVDWVAGRTAEQKRELAARITTTAVAEIGGLDPVAVWVVSDDVAPGDWRWEDGSSPIPDLRALVRWIEFPGNPFGVERAAHPVGQLSPFSGPWHARFVARCGCHKMSSATSSPGRTCPSRSSDSVVTTAITG